jgi:hypothetical protein
VTCARGHVCQGGYNEIILLPAGGLSIIDARAATASRLRLASQAGQQREWSLACPVRLVPNGKSPSGP